MPVITKYFVLNSNASLTTLSKSLSKEPKSVCKEATSKPDSLINECQSSFPALPLGIPASLVRTLTIKGVL